MQGWTHGFYPSGAPIFDNRIKQAREDVLRALIQKYKKKEKGRVW